MSEDNISIIKKTERFYDDLVDLWRRRPLICVVAILILGAYAFLQFWKVPTLQRELASERQAHRDDVHRMTARIQELEAELTPFRSYAIHKFASANSTAMHKLAEHLASVDTELKNARAEISRVKTSVTELQPSFRLLEANQSKDGDTWLTRMVFGSKSGHPFARYGVTVVFDKGYESANPYITGDGIVASGKLQILEGAQNSRIFRFFGTQLLANNYLVVEFRSKEQIRVMAIQLEPVPE